VISSNRPTFPSHDDRLLPHTGDLHRWRWVYLRKVEPVSVPPATVCNVRLGEHRLGREPSDHLPEVPYRDPGPSKDLHSPPS